MDPKRAYTDSIILTVTYVFFNEALRSERDTALNVHAPALKKMVDARGGIGVIATNGKDGLILSRYLSWCDRIIASTLGSQPLFGDYFEDTSDGKTQWNGIWSKVQTLIMTRKLCASIMTGYHKFLRTIQHTDSLLPNVIAHDFWKSSGEQVDYDDTLHNQQTLIYSVHIPQHSSECSELTSEHSLFIPIHAIERHYMRVR
ncbi:hypothetical protein E4T44_08893 [Aureobasidium sp. EXF-8845]|nr:hypothetical protein E4T44_08893 [Aureobasidium sp. EXF-8845]KAI4843039.1 hypothetical protein E4T45_08796 [Aureobasidium sp. EXF-8846]